MGRNRFIASGTKRFDLTDGDWVEIKEYLNTGETKAVESAGESAPVLVRNADGIDKVVERIDWNRFEIERAFVFITDWSFRDDKDKPVKVSLHALSALDPESFSEINAVIITQILNNAAEARAKKAAREEAKKGLNTPPSTNGSQPEPDASAATSME